MVNTVFAPARWLSVRQSCQDHLTTEVVQWKLIAAAEIESIPRLLHLHAPNLHLKDETKFRFRKTTSPDGWWTWRKDVCTTTLAFKFTAAAPLTFAVLINQTGISKSKIDDNWKLKKHVKIFVTVIIFILPIWLPIVNDPFEKVLAFWACHELKRKTQQNEKLMTEDNKIFKLTTRLKSELVQYLRPLYG